MISSTCLASREKADSGSSPMRHEASADERHDESGILLDESSFKQNKTCIDSIHANSLTMPLIIILTRRMPAQYMLAYISGYCAALT